MKINVIGLGYIGLPTALMLASHGVSVVGSEKDAARVAALQAGEAPFHEQGLDDVFQKARQNGIAFTTDVVVADVYIISVATPYDAVTKKVDVTALQAAARQVLAVAPDEAILVVESTIAPGTMEASVRPLVVAAGKHVHLAHAPERILPGNMIHELEWNNRTIGADDVAIGERVKALYASFCRGEIVVTDLRTAEMTKVVENTFRAVNIAFANELMHLCHESGLDVYDIIRICNMHPRVNILEPGPGVGGHCIPVDPWFLVGDYPTLTPLIRTALETNAAMPRYVLRRIHEIARQEHLPASARVGLYGLTYKEDVDDMRESPTLQLLALPEARDFVVYDPMIHEDVVAHQVHDLDAFLDAVDFVVIMVKHAEIRERQEKLRGKVVLDGHHSVALPGVYHL